MTAAARSGAAFDAIAAEYDAVFSESRIGRAQRQVVWEMLDRVFLPGQYILEINCGTGLDATHMAQRGIRVHACDASPTMVDIARARISAAGAAVYMERRATEELAGLPGRYDGLLSNFGGLNCIDDLGSAVAEVKRLVRVGGSAVICYMGAFCAWEMLWYLARGNPKKAFRRAKRMGVTARVGNGESFLVQYPTFREMASAFAPEFRLVERVGVGVFVPPSYVEALAMRHPRALNCAMRLDRALAWWPVFRSTGDHVLLRFEKVCE